MTKYKFLYNSETRMMNRAELLQELAHLIFHQANKNLFISEDDCWEKAGIYLEHIDNKDNHRLEGALDGHYFRIEGIE